MTLAKKSISIIILRLLFVGKHVDYNCKYNYFCQLQLQLDVNCDFLINNNVWTRFYEFCGGHFEFCWVIFYDKLIGILLMGFLWAILNIVF